MSDPEDSSVSPIRRTPDETYLIYAGAANRSLMVTAELAELPLGTIKRWASEQRWADRADKETAILRGAMDRQVRSVLAQKMPQRLRKLDQLCESPDDMVALKANIEWFKHYGPPPPDAPASSEDGDPNLPDPVDYDTLTVRELAQLVRQSRERRSG